LKSEESFELFFEVLKQVAKNYVLPIKVIGLEPTHSKCYRHNDGKVYLFHYTDERAFNSLLKYNRKKPEKDAYFNVLINTYLDVKDFKIIREKSFSDYVPFEGLDTEDKVFEKIKEITTRQNANNKFFIRTVDDKIEILTHPINIESQSVSISAEEDLVEGLARLEESKVEHLAMWETHYKLYQTQEAPDVFDYTIPKELIDVQANNPQLKSITLREEIVKPDILQLILRANWN
jgi:hypothetical protein